MRHVGNVDGCGGEECQGSDSEDYCVCCGEPVRDHSIIICAECGVEDSWNNPEHDEDNDEYDHEYEATDGVYCGCCCPGEVCWSCEHAQEGSLEGMGIYPALQEWIYENFERGGGRSASWRAWFDFHTEHGNIVLRWLELGFTEVHWPDGFGGDKWGFIARVAYEYATGEMSAHAFMDRCWTLHHNGGNIFDKMYNDFQINRMLRWQAEDQYARLIRHASPLVRDLWIVRPYILAEATDRDPVWLGVNVPTGVEW